MPITQEIYDVVVAGAGPAGCAAAIEAARSGAKVLLLERASRPGGVAVSNGTPAFMGCAYEQRIQLLRGIGEELVRRLDARGAVMQKASRSFPIGADKPILEDVISSEEDISLELNRMLDEAKVDVLCYCTIYGCQRKGRRLTYVSAFCAGENLVFHGKAFVDCTGDVLLAHLCGLPLREATGTDRMTKTVMIKVSGLKPFSIPEMKERFKDIRSTFPFAEQDALMLHPSGMNGDFLLNVTLTSGNPFSPFELTRMDRTLREQIPVILQWLRGNIPEFKECVLESTATAIGVRNGRQIVGRDTITCDDLDRNTPVNEPVAIGLRMYGGHGGKEFCQEWAHFNQGLRQIPYGALLSPEADNYVVGGRGISTEVRAITAIRMMAQCFATGQAAGLIAAKIAEMGGVPSYNDIRNALAVLLCSADTLAYNDLNE